MIQEENTAIRKEKILTRKLIIGFRKKWWIIIVATILALVAGYAYSTTIKPSFTATEKVIFTANVKTKETEEEGKGSPYSATATQQYMPTVIDFINEGVVLSRASLYYDYFINHEYEDVSEFLVLVNTGEIEKKPDFDPTKKVPMYISIGGVTVSSGSVTGSTDFTIYVGYTGGDKEVIRDKVRILIAAAEREAQETEEIVQDDQVIVINKYFGVEIKLGDYGLYSMVSNTSNTKLLIVAALAGFVLGCVIIGLISLLDNKVKDREELELITSTNLLAYIDMQ